MTWLIVLIALNGRIVVHTSRAMPSHAACVRTARRLGTEVRQTGFTGWARINQYGTVEVATCVRKGLTLTT